MKIISDFVAHLNRDATPPTVEIFRGIASTGLRIQAVNLLAQFETANGDAVLVLDENSPYEEMLHFCLLRSDRLIDHLLYGAPYASGIFNLMRAGNDRVLFTFASDEVLCLSVTTDGSRWPQRNVPGASYVTSPLSKHYLHLKIEG
jgi:hypothetical protein